MNFRTSLKKDIPLRIVDLIGHVCFAIILPGHWWFQFLPDVFIPMLLLHSILTNELMYEKTGALLWHKFLHTIYGPIFLGCFGAIWSTPKIGAMIGVQGLVHVIWDQLTHEQEYQKRSLWKI
jgi:hypothetical protein